MRAAILETSGRLENLRIGEVDAPKPEDDELLIRVCAAALNPADLKVISGEERGFLHARNYPAPIGFDFSGVVDQVGPSAAGRARGDEVFGFLPYSRSTRQGSFAEFLATKPQRVGIKPPGVTHTQAAAAATAGCTALQALKDKGRLEPGQNVLVHGASGGVGSYAVQIANEMGAEVWATASAMKADFVKNLGAAHVIDYETTPLRGLRRNFDLVLDVAAVSSFMEVTPILRDGGGYVTLLPSPRLALGVLASFVVGKRCSFLAVRPRAEDLDLLGRWLGQGRVKASVDKTYPLEEITRGLASLKRGEVRGKVAIAIATPTRRSSETEL